MVYGACMCHLSSNWDLIIVGISQASKCQTGYTYLILVAGCPHHPASIRHDQSSCRALDLPSGRFVCMIQSTCVVSGILGRYDHENITQAFLFVCVSARVNVWQCIMYSI